ncbi:hypothetical protein EYF80_039336 [Liparis tanakae]|uniref:Uncharacterized protein n=1 Tax=Liparis tanakae TaxID=230148 RepID=A0A4Z2GA65_9TELE|nr:hypothetical protein EYF80_039336 [Liparis tanakae]
MLENIWYAAHPEDDRCHCGQQVSLADGWKPTLIRRSNEKRLSNATLGVCRVLEIQRSKQNLILLSVQLELNSHRHHDNYHKDDSQIVSACSIRTTQGVD